MKIVTYCFCLLIMHYDDNSFSKNIDQIVRYNVGQSWSRLGPNCQILFTMDFFGKFKCKIYVPIEPHYATQDFTNIFAIGHEI